jgi:hypothetical protein
MLEVGLGHILTQQEAAVETRRLMNLALVVEEALMMETLVVETA